ncbi:MAG: MATE family efflux transporter [Clostridiales Family XIII bacterium]|jgi:putative MATE family efflux protein|nr:MATE family efflux transporter [Clostridiales Family XIII bacterium]
MAGKMGGVEPGSEKLGTRPVGRLLAAMSIPPIVTMTAQSVYHIVDSIFVARISEKALAATTLVFPIPMFLMAIAAGTGVGVGSLMARSYGEKNREKVSAVANQAYLLVIASWLVFAAFGILLTMPFLHLLTDDPELLSLASVFCTITTVGSLGAFFQFNIERILQSVGLVYQPLIFNIVGTVINIVLNPILIFGKFGFPALGIAGSATATVIGQCSAAALGLILLARAKSDVSFALRTLRFNFPIIKDIYRVGAPSIFMYGISSLSSLLMNAILMAYSVTAVAVLGIYYRLQTIIITPVFGIGQGALPIISFNYGARNIPRVRKTFILAMVSSVTAMLVGTALTQMFPQEIMSLFHASANLNEIGAFALRVISISFAMSGVSIMTANFYQSIGVGFVSFIISSLRQLVFIIPAALLLWRVFEPRYVWYCFPVAETATCLISLCLIARTFRRKLSL